MYGKMISGRLSAQTVHVKTGYWSALTMRVGRWC